MEEVVRERAARTAVDSFIAVERIYRHSYQILMAMKDKLKEDLNLKFDSPLIANSFAIADPKSWIHHFRGLHLAKEKISLDEYIKDPYPILFIQASLYNPNGQEPILRYGVIDRIFDVDTYKGARFDDYFRMTLGQLHSGKDKSHIKASHCQANVTCDERFLLDVREDKDVISVVEEILDKYSEIILK